MSQNWISYVWVVLAIGGRCEAMKRAILLSLLNGKERLFESDKWTWKWQEDKLVIKNKKEDILYQVPLTSIAFVMMVKDNDRPNAKES